MRDRESLSREALEKGTDDRDHALEYGVRLSEGEV